MLDGVLDGLSIALMDSEKYYDLSAFCEGEGYFLNGVFED